MGQIVHVSLLSSLIFWCNHVGLTGGSIGLPQQMTPGRSTLEFRDDVGGGSVHQDGTWQIDAQCRCGAHSGQQQR